MSLAEHLGTTGNGERETVRRAEIESGKKYGEGGAKFWGLGECEDVRRTSSKTRVKKPLRQMGWLSILSTVLLFTIHPFYCFYLSGIPVLNLNFTD